MRGKKHAYGCNYVILRICVALSRDAYLLNRRSKIDQEQIKEFLKSYFYLTPYDTYMY